MYGHIYLKYSDRQAWANSVHSIQMVQNIACNPDPGKQFALTDTISMIRKIKNKVNHLLCKQEMDISARLVEESTWRKWINSLRVLCKHLFIHSS